MQEEKNNKVVNLASALNEADKKARKRDFENEQALNTLDYNGVPQEQLEQAMGIISQANGGRELYMGFKRSPQSRVRFVQIMQENLNYLYENEYLTGREKIFIMDIMPLISFDSNGLVFDVKAKNPVPLNISELAKIIKATRANTNNTVNSLVKKGIIAKGESGVEGNNAKAYSLFINPHIAYAGDKDNVNQALQILFHKAMKMKILKDVPNKLF